MAVRCETSLLGTHPPLCSLSLVWDPRLPPLNPLSCVPPPPPLQAGPVKDNTARHKGGGHGPSAHMRHARARDYVPHPDPYRLSVCMYSRMAWSRNHSKVPRPAPHSGLREQPGANGEVLTQPHPYANIPTLTGRESLQTCVSVANRDRDCAKILCAISNPCSDAGPVPGAGPCESLCESGPEAFSR